MNLVRSELRKLLTTKVWLFLLLGTVLFALLQPTLTLAFAGNKDSGIPDITDPRTQLMALEGPASAVIFTLILGIIGMTQEYRHRTATPTFLATPHRWKIIVTKLAVYLLVGVVFAVIAGVFVYAEVAIWVGGAGGSVPLSGDNAQVLFGATAAAALYGVVGVGIGALIRNQVGAVVGALAYMFVVESILRAIPATQDVFKYLPGGASEAMYTLTSNPQQPVDLLTPVQGGLLLVGYGVVAAAIALALPVRRDVN